MIVAVTLNSQVMFGVGTPKDSQYNNSESLIFNVWSGDIPTITGGSEIYIIIKHN